eukprot:TRINITY_DN1090_c0_g1_i1.p1 TRINITY_DN1090_c0_g1~~TRINITY_DN1090_c0_g1_i1.p1  ORF type:complete len:544 (-),score=102.07 TRINITY_DN1090_c0_g1_i1:227-1858(-)
MATDLGSKVVRESRSKSDADLFSPFSRRANRNSVPQKFDAHVMKSIVPKLQSSLASMDEESNPSSGTSESEPEESTSMSHSRSSQLMVQPVDSHVSRQDQVPTANSESSERSLAEVPHNQKNTNNTDAISSSHNSTRKRINSHEKTKSSSSRKSSSSKNSEKYHDVANDSQSASESREHVYNNNTQYSYANGVNNNNNHELTSSHQLEHSASSSHVSRRSSRGYDINLNYTNNNLPIYNPITDSASVSSDGQQQLKDSSSSRWELNGEIRRARDEAAMGTPQPGSRDLRRRIHNRSRSESTSRQSEVKAEQSSQNEYSKGTESSDEDDESASEVRRRRIKRRLNSKILSEDKNKRLLYLQSDEVQKNFKDLSTLSNRFQSKLNEIMEYLNEIDKGEEGAECNGSRMLSLNQRKEELESMEELMKILNYTKEFIVVRNKTILERKARLEHTYLQHQQQQLEAEEEEKRREDSERDELARSRRRKSGSGGSSSMSSRKSLRQSGESSRYHSGVSRQHSQFSASPTSSSRGNGSVNSRLNSRPNWK